MNKEALELNRLAARLSRVEARNGRLTKLMLSATLACALVLLLGAAQRRTVEAEEFILKDARGNVTGRFTMSADRPTLTLYDSQGIAEVALVGGKEPFLTLSNAKGDEQVALSSLKDLYGLALYGKSIGSRNGIRAGLGVFKGSPGLSLYNAAGQEQVNLTLLEGQGTDLALSDSSGANRAFLKVTDGETNLELSDKEGFKTTIGVADLESRRTGETRKTSAASVVLFGKDGKLLWKAP